MATNTGNAHTIGLTCDSTAVALGWNKHEQCDVNDWHNIVAVVKRVASYYWPEIGWHGSSGGPK